LPLEGVTLVHCSVKEDSHVIESFDKEFILIVEVELLLIGVLSPVEVEMFFNLSVADDLNNLDLLDGLCLSNNIWSLVLDGGLDLPVLEELVLVHIFDIVL
jgi:hypothetical protein